MAFITALTACLILIQIEETDTTFAIGWKGRYRIEGPAFVYSDEDTGRVATILGYPTDKLTQAV